MMRRTALSLLFSLIMSAPAGASTVSRLYDFQPHTPAQADQIDEEFDNIIDALNGSLDGSNIADGTIATADLATASVTTTKIASGSVTNVKRADLGQATSNSSLTRYVQSQNEIQIDTLTASITPSGRPVWVGLQAVPGLPGRILYQHAGVGATDNAARVNIKRDGATRNVTMIGARQTGAGAITSVSCSAIHFVDVSPDGGESHAYTVFASVATADTGIVRIENCQLILFEL